MLDRPLSNVDVNYKRNNTNNVFKWTFTKEGTYHVLTLEPYTAKYVKVIKNINTKITLAIIDYENHDVQQCKFVCDNNDVELIFNDAVRTFAQNAVDLLTDCPSRERAGWLSDSYFSSTAELYLTSENKVERAFLENYTLLEKCNLPKGMIPMVYPSDDYDQVFIPNWSLWYILEVEKYACLHNDHSLVEPSIKKLLEF